MKIHSEPGYDCRSFMTCDWLDENGRHVMHERTYWERPLGPKFSIGARLSCLMRIAATEPQVRYWITDVLYTDKALAEQEASQHGFRAQEGFYCEPDNLHWFPIFSDFDAALKFLEIKTGIKYGSE